MVSSNQLQQDLLAYTVPATRLSGTPYKLIARCSQLADIFQEEVSAL